MKRPLVACCLYWVIGTCIALCYDEAFRIAAVISMLLITIIATRLRHWETKMAVILMAMLLASVCYGYIVDRLNVSPLSQKFVTGERDLLTDSDAEVSGTIDSPVEVDGDKASFVLLLHSFSFIGTASEKTTIKERIQVSIRLQKEEEQREVSSWGRGDALQLAGTIRKPDEARNYGGFDYQKYLHTKRIHWLLNGKGLSRAEAHRPKRLSLQKAARWIDDIRFLAGQRMDKLFTPLHAGFMNSLLLGIRDDLDPQQFKHFSTVGLTHVLAISGLHVAVFVAGVLWLLRLFGLTRERSVTLALWLVPLYIVLTGGTPSVVRSGLMAMIALYCSKKGILKDGLHIVGLVAWLMLLWNPYALLDVSFQLSFLVTIGLMLGVPSVSKLLPIKYEGLRSSLAVTFVAQLASFPLSIYYFNQFSIWSWLANLLFVPIISFIVLPLGTMSLLLSFVWFPLAHGLALLTQWINDAVFACVGYIARIRFGAMIWGTPELWWIVSYGVLLAIGIWAASGWLRFNRNEELWPILPSQNRSSAMKAMAVGCILGWAALLVYGYAPQFMDRSAVVDIIDVGQGDAILIRTPSHRTILIDGGGTLSFRKPGDEWKERKDPFEVGENLLVPLLKKRGIHRIDTLIVTHEDQDHIGGLAAVVKNIPVGRIFFNGTLKPGDTPNNFFSESLQRRIPLYAVHAGQMLQLDAKTTMRILLPSIENNGTKDPAANSSSTYLSIAEDQNELSVVCLLDMYGKTFLLMGDLDEGTERRWLQDESNRSAYNSFRGVDVLKAGHHGSKTSTSEEWLDYWEPKSVVISVGRYNVYGHPNPNMLARLTERRIGWMSTAKHGEIQFQVQPDKLKVRTKIYAVKP